MKHYATNKWNELGAIECLGRERFRAENVARSKHVYRKRERRALDRMVEELVIEEIGNRRSRSYWESELDDLFGELQALEAEEELALEHYHFFGYGYDKNWYKAKFDELFEQIDEANYQLSLFG